MKQRRYTEAQILGFLKEARGGIPVKELCRKHGFSDASSSYARRSPGNAIKTRAAIIKKLSTVVYAIPVGVFLALAAGSLMTMLVIRKPTPEMARVIGVLVGFSDLDQIDLPGVGAEPVI